MSQEKVETMRAALDAFARRDLPGMLRFMEPKVQFEPQLAELEGSYEGHDGVRAFFIDAWETLPAFRIDYPDIRDLGDRALALGTFGLRGGESGIKTEVPLAIVARFRDGLITHLKDYGDKDGALEAAGLSE